jgi:hypothetical protein
MCKFFILLIVPGFLSLFSFGQNHKPVPVLIVDGFSHHDWKQTSALIKQILEKSGLFKVDITTVPTDSMQMKAWKPVFGKYAVIIRKQIKTINWIW